MQIEKAHPNCIQHPPAVTEHLGQYTDSRKQFGAALRFKKYDCNLDLQYRKLAIDKNLDVVSDLWVFDKTNDHDCAKRFACMKALNSAFAPNITSELYRLDVIVLDSLSKEYIPPIIDVELTRLSSGYIDIGILLHRIVFGCCKCKRFAFTLRRNSVCSSDLDLLVRCKSVYLRIYL